MLHFPAYLLADHGFDVWMGNARENRYSRNNTHLSPDGNREKRSKFWNFSWHEIGIYDLPAKIDYILMVTEKTKLYYIGYSQGVTAFMIMCAERPEYNEKIIVANMLAPAIYLDPMPNLMFHAISEFVSPLSDIGNFIGLYELLPNRDIYGNLAKLFCSKDLTSKLICEHLVFFLLEKPTIRLNDVSEFYTE